MTTVWLTCGVGGCQTKVAGNSARGARKALDAHRLSCHPDFKPQKGSRASRIPRLD